MTSQAFADRIPYAEPTLSGLENVLRGALSLSGRTLAFERKPATDLKKESPPSDFTVQLQFMSADYLGQYTEPDGRQQRWTIAKALRKGASTEAVWVGCRLRFDRESEQYYLTTVSLLFLVQRGSLYPLIRAEWDYRGLDAEELEHGQPHWHVLSSSVMSDAMPSLEPQEFSATELVQDKERQKIHLAMATDWHTATGSGFAQPIPNASSLRNWVFQTAAYSIDQIHYALRKSGGKAAPQVADETLTARDFGLVAG